MQRKNIIVVIENGVPECFGNFKKTCDVKEFPYHSLKMKSFPITYNDVVIHRVEFK